MTILSICQSAADELSLVRPSSVISTDGDETARRLSRHLTKCCKHLLGRYDWQALRKELTFSTVATAAQTALPSDFLRFVPGTFWNRSTRRPVFGPLTPAEWQNIQANLQTAVEYSFIQRGGTLYFTPVPAAGETIALEYIKNAIGTTSGGTDLSAFAADTDIAAFDEELLILGVIYLHRQSERLDYAEEMRQFELRFSDLVKMDGGRRTLNMDAGFAEPRGTVTDWYVDAT